MGSTTARPPAQGLVYSSKRALLPFVKLIHPDIFALHGAEVKEANLQCVQSLNELWDTLGELEKRANEGGGEVFVRTPLKPKYELHCFSKSSTALRRVALSLQPPLELTRQQNVSAAAARKALARVTKPLLSFFIDAGVSADALPAAAGDAPGAGAGDDEPDPLGSGAVLSRQQLAAANAQMGAIMFDRAVSARHFQSPPVRSAFSSTPSPSAASLLGAAAGAAGAAGAAASGSASPGTGASRGRMTQSQQLLRQHCETFLRSGQVLVQGLELHEEADAIERLRGFLLDYGEVLRFSPGAWANVVVVLTKPEAQMAGAEQQQRQQQRQPGAGEPKRKKTRGRYDCQAQAGGAQVLTVPHNFRTGELLEHLRTSLPQTNPFQ